MSDRSRPDRNAPRRRIAGQRRTADRSPASAHPIADTTRTTAADREPASAASQLVELQARTGTAEEPETITGTQSTPRSVDAAVQPEVEPETISDGSATPGAAPPPGGLGRLLTVMVAVLLVLMVTAAVVLGIKVWKGRQAEQGRSEAATAASKAAELVLSYDYRSLDENFTAARAVLTPEFAADFDVTTKVVAEQARKTKATVKAEVREVGVRDGDADRVTLVVFVNQTTTSTITQGKPRVDLNRARFTMVRHDDRWLVQEIDGL
jgi:Mce-associated membrane protein